MQIIEERFTDIAGVEHRLRACKREGGGIHFVVYFGDNYTLADTAEKAFDQAHGAIDHNLPHMFVRESPEKQALVLDWIRAHVKPGRRGKAKRYGSYHLKHVVESAIGEYVGNGEMKGALVQAGYIPPVGTDMYDTNWSFVLERGLSESW